MGKLKKEQKTLFYSSEIRDGYTVSQKKNFVPPYFFQDEYSDPGILNGHAKLINSETTAILVDYLNARAWKNNF